MKNKRGSKAPPKVISSIVAMFLVSAFIKFGGASLAIANEPATTDKPIEAAHGAAVEPSADTKKLLEIIATRTAALNAKEKELEELSYSLNAAKVLVEQNLIRLEEAEKSLEATIARVDGASEGDLERLTTVYEAMKPKVAAALFEKMTPEFAAGFMGRMSPQAAAGIMSGLSAETSYAISVVLAGRNTNAPKK